MYLIVNTSGDSSEYNTGSYGLKYKDNMGVKTLGLVTLCLLFLRYLFF